MYIAIAYFPVCDVINFETDLIFLMKPFFYMTKKLGQKFKVTQKTERAFTAK